MSLVVGANASFGHCQLAEHDAFMAPPFVHFHLLLQYLRSFLNVAMSVAKVKELNPFTTSSTCDDTASSGLVNCRQIFVLMLLLLMVYTML